MVRFGFETRAGLLAVLVLVTGCYEWAFVHPTELPKLSAGARELERTDGGRFEVRHKVTAKVDTLYGALKFTQPWAAVDDDTLTIASATGGEARIPLEHVKSVRVGQISVLDTVAAFVVLGAAVTGTVLLFLFAQGGTGTTQ